MIMIFTTLNMWNYLINNGMIKYADDKKGFIAALQGLSTLITLIWFLIYIPFSGLWESVTGLSRATMLLMFLELFFMPSYEYYCAVRRYEYNVGKVVILTLIPTVLTPTSSIPLIFVCRDQGIAAIVGRAIGYTSVYFGVFIWMVKGCHRCFRYGR